MRGSTAYQVGQIFAESGINQIGESKHEAKETARADGAQSWEQVGREIGIHSYGTADTYREVWRSAFDHAKGEGCKDVEKLTSQHIQSYLQGRVESGVARSTFAKEAAACAKLEQALNRYSEAHNRGNGYDFRAGISEARSGAGDLSRFEGSRAYERPAELVQAVSNRDHQIAAAIQYESNARVHEVAQIRAEQLKGYREDSASGQRGVIQIQGKGGKITDKLVSPQTYRAVAQAIQERGQYKISEDAYRDSLKAAAAATGQRYDERSTHGLRWNAAQERFSQLQVHGATYAQALAQVSQELGHERSEITLHYLH
jgi:site-specific recombinase XerC